MRQQKPVLNDRGLLLDVESGPVCPGAAVVGIGRGAVARPELGGQQIDALLGLPDMDKLMDQRRLTPQRSL